MRSRGQGPVRVVLVLDWFLKYAAEQAVGLKAAGAEVLVVCRDHAQEFDGSRAEWQVVVDHIRAAGIDVVVVRGRTASVVAARDAFKARCKVRRFRPDIIHAHENHDPWLLLVAAGRPLILTVHDPVPHDGQPELSRVRSQLKRRWFQVASGFVVHGAGLASHLRGEIGCAPTAVVPHGVAPAATFTAVPADRSILFFGRLEPYKGLAILIAAMQTVWTLAPETKLIVAGKGSEADVVPEDSRIVRMFQYVPEAQVNPLLDSVRLVVAPYLEATGSGVVALAVARGIPTVVTDRGALPETAVNNSLVVRAGDSDALADAILAHLDHDEELRRQVHGHATNQLSWQASGERTIDFYKRVLQSPRLLFICPDLGAGGAERHWSILIPRVIVDGFTARLITTDGRGQFYDGLSADGIDAICLRERPRGRTALGALSTLLFGCDVIVTRATSAHLLGFIVSSLRPSRRWIVNWHRPIGLPMPTRRRLILRQILSHAAAIAAVSESQVEELERLGARRAQIKVIPNGTDFSPALADRAAVREELGLKSGDVVFLLAGRLEPQKRLQRHPWSSRTRVV
jgi:glycosyltransferase involved in cell wall biosynthesis